MTGQHVPVVKRVRRPRGLITVALPPPPDDLPDDRPHVLALDPQQVRRRVAAMRLVLLGAARRGVEVTPGFYAGG